MRMRAEATAGACRASKYPRSQGRRGINTLNQEQVFSLQDDRKQQGEVAVHFKSAGVTF